MLAALLRKYVEIKRLREEESAIDPTPAMRALAEAYPGSLRELDALPMETIDSRIASLEQAIGCDSPELWMLALDRYHAWLRLALRMRREVPERTVESARAWLTHCQGGRATSVDDALIEAILFPPGGRLSLVVLARVAAELETTRAWLDSLLSGRRA